MLRGLTVLHFRKGKGSPAPSSPVPSRSGPALILDTCQRWICVLKAIDPVPTPPGMERFTGEDAYAFLLRVTTGLASRLQGETNIFGQVKTAWAPHGTHFPWLQRLFEDTKEIRARHLADVGGPSYGRLVRRWLHPIAHPSGRPLLLVGAGELAQTVAPWLTGFHLHLLNRDPAKAESLAQSLRNHGHGRQGISVVPHDLAPTAWRQAHGIVLCIPFDPAGDDHRIRSLQSRAALPGAVPPLILHLGGTHAQAGRWTDVPGFHSLDDIFLLHHQESGAQLAHIRRAERACRERARLRALGPSLSIPHGWEDLASFPAWEPDPADQDQPDIHPNNLYTHLVHREPALA